MGDGNSDNLIRRMNREGLAFWETDAPPQERPRDADPMSSGESMPAVVEPHNTSSFVASGAQSYRHRVVALEQKQQELDAEVETRQRMIDGKAWDIAQQEGRICEQEQQLLKAREVLQRMRNELAYAERELASDKERSNDNRRETDAVCREWQEHQQEREREQRLEQARKRQQESHIYHPAHVPPANGGPGQLREKFVSSNGARVQPLSPNFQPPQWCFDRLLQRGISAEYAQEQLIDFKMYWLNTGEARKAWEFRFVKHVIYQWERERKAQDDGCMDFSRTTEEKLADTSWADGPFLDFGD